MSDRHLRRIFQTEHGVTPLQYLQTRRLLLAKQLLTDSHLPMAQVALASGFNSLRRFNAAFAESYRMSPSRLRGEAGDADADSDAAITLKLGYRAPYDVDALLRFIALRAVPEVEVVDGRRMRRSLRAGTVGGVAGWVEAEFVQGAPVVLLRYAPQLAAASGRVVACVRRWLDLDAQPQTIDAALANLPGAPGLRLPGSLDAFELAVRAVLGQQVTVAAARTLACRLVERFGEPLRTPWGDVSCCFPAPSALAEAKARADRRARHHPYPFRCDPVHRTGMARTRCAARTARSARAPDRAPVRPARHRPVDRALHRDACPRLARCVSTERRGGAESLATTLRYDDAARSRSSRPSLATVARLCRAAALERCRRRAGRRRSRGHGWPTPQAARCPTSGEKVNMNTTTDSISLACTAQATIATPLGGLLLARTAHGLAGAWFEGQKHHPEPLAAALRPDDELLRRAADQLREYFAGEREGFELPLDLHGTAFQRAVWQQLLAIPSAGTTSYAAIAKALGNASAVRAVGGAVGRNPVSVIVPCHRVVGVDGSMTGYAGGVDRKRALLDLERALAV